MSIIKKPMLAEMPEDDKYERLFPVLATPKLDGIRCLRIDGKTLSRKFLHIPNRKIQRLAANLPEGLDGELFELGLTFNEIQHIVMSEDAEDEMHYNVFDYVTDSLKEPYSERMKKLEALVLPDFCKKILPTLINTRQELDEFEANCLAKGYEGAITRLPNSPYKCGRATPKQQWLVKIKTFVDSEAEIIGFEEQMHNENEAEVDELGHTKRSKAMENLVPAGTLGKFVVRECMNSRFPWKGQIFKVGVLKGFDAKTRKEIWDHQDKYLGKILTYKFQPHGIKDLPRIPIGKAIRSPIDF